MSLYPSTVTLNKAVVARWAENPYWQHFRRETFFQHRLPIDPSSMTRRRNRIGEEGVEWLLTETIEAGKGLCTSIRKYYVLID